MPYRNPRRNGNANYGNQRGNGNGGNGGGYQGNNGGYAGQRNGSDRMTSKLLELLENKMAEQQINSLTSAEQQRMYQLLSMSKGANLPPAMLFGMLRGNDSTINNMLTMQMLNGSGGNTSAMLPMLLSMSTLQGQTDTRPQPNPLLSGRAQPSMDLESPAMDLDPVAVANALEALQTQLSALKSSMDKLGKARAASSDEGEGHRPNTRSRSSV